MRSTKTNAKLPIQALTGLRFIAAITIVLEHYGLVLNCPPKISLLASQARASVGLFFILSGFILFYNYHEEFQVGVDHKRFWQFARARFARIYPMHVVALLINTPIVLYFLITDPIQARQSLGDWFTPPLIGLSWLANLTLIQVYIPVASFVYIWNAPAWSIASELAFYISFPFFIAYVISRFKNTSSLLIFALKLFAIETVTFVAVISVIFLCKSRAFYFVDLIPYHMPFFRIWEFFIGCTLGAVFLRDHQKAESHPLVSKLRNKKFRNLVLAFTLSGIFVLATSSIVALNLPLDNYRKALSWSVLYTPLFALMIITLAFGRTFVSPLLEHPWMLLLGEASYSLYISHFTPIIVLMHAKAKGFELGIFWAVILIILSIIASIWFLKFVEMPARRALRGSKPSNNTLKTP